MSTTATGGAAELLDELDALGVQLEADGERLRYRPRGRVPGSLVGRMRAHKAELVALVARRGEIDRAIAQQLAKTVPYIAAKGRLAWVPADYLEQLRRCGLL